MLTPLQFLVIVFWFIFLLFAIDAYKRKWLNLLHFGVFFVGLVLILFFWFNQEYLDRFGEYFGARWSDLVVYIAIIFLAYLYFEMLHKITKNQKSLTDIVNSEAVRNYRITPGFENFDTSALDKDEKSNYVFHIRVFNEQKVIWEVIENIIRSWYKKIVLVNDWSTDGTDWVLEEKINYHKNNACIIVLNHLVNRWGGAANKTGFYFLKKFWKYLNANWMVTFDADGQMDVNDMENFKKYINTWNYDILIGSRFIEWASAESIPIGRRIVLFWAKFITFVLNWFWITDPHNGYRVINLQALDKINLNSDGMAYASELLDSIKDHQLKFAQVPVNIRYTDYSVSKWQRNTNAFAILWELIYKKFFYR